MALINVWHLRRVAETSAKPCDICYKPTTSVLITPDQQDHFPICQGHLKDGGFCSPIVNDAEVAAQKKKELMDHEIESIQKEYEEKLKKRKSKDEDKKEKEKGKDEKEKEGEKKADYNRDTAEKEKNDKIAAVSGQAIAPNVEEIPRIYELHKIFYQKRLDRRRNAERAKRDRERLNALKNPTLFPSVPRDSLG